MQNKLKYDKYSEYKESEVKWLGKIPKNWELLPAKRYHKVVKEFNRNRDSDNVLSLTLRGVVNNNLDNPEGLVPKDYATYQLFDKDNLVFKLIDLENVSTSRVGLVHEKGIMSSAYIRLVTGTETDSKFAYYYYYSLYKNEVFNKLGSGVRSTLGPNDLLNLQFLKPSYEEQTAIASFLDEKTSKIDNAISNKERLIKLLKERKQIIIQELVTGKKVWDEQSQSWIKPTKTKDSGVEWIGEIPEEWEVTRLRNMFKFNKGLTITKENLEDEGIPCINYGEIHSKFGFEVNPQINQLKCVSVEYLKHSSNSLIKNGDFIFADTSEDLDGSGNFTYLNYDGLAFAGYHTIIGKFLQKNNARFFAYVFDSISFRSQVRTKMKGVKVYSITQSTLKDLYCWIPNRIEQEKIIEQLDNESDKIDKSITLQEQQIDKLKEYKSVLIDSAVRGRVKVC